MHGHIKLGYFSELHPPTFRISREREGRLTLHYLPGKPTRKGLSPLVVGIIKSLGEEHLGLTALKIKQKKWTDKGAEEDRFVIKWKAVSSRKKAYEESVSTTPLVYGLDPQGLNRAFPFHFIFNQKLEVLQCGKSLSRLVPLEVGDQVTNYFELVAPAMASFNDWKFLTNRGKTEVFIFKHAYDDYKSLKLKGQLIWQPMLKSMCFVGSPLLDSFADLDYFGLNLSDFAVHDPAKDALFLNHAKDVREDTSNLPDSASTVASSLSSSSSDLSLVSSSSCVSLQSSSDTSSSPSVPSPLGITLSSLVAGGGESAASGPQLPVPPSSPVHHAVSPRPPVQLHSENSSSSSSSSSGSSSARRQSSAGCPFSTGAATSAAVTSLPTLKSNTKERHLTQPPSPTLPSSPPAPALAPLRSPQTSSSLLDKLFGSKQKSHYTPKSGKPDKAGMLHSAGGINGRAAFSRPQPLKALLSAAGGGLIGGGSSSSSSNGTAAGTMDSDGVGSGRKRSKSCSDSDELLVIDEQMRVIPTTAAAPQPPLSGDGHKLPHGGGGGKHRRGALVSLVSDEEAVRAARHNGMRASPVPQQAMTIPPAGPLSLQGRERLENAFQELLLEDSRRNFKLAMELLNLTYAETSVDKLVHALLEFYNYHGKTVNFIQTAIELDVRSANEEGVLMRSETVGTRVLSLYMARAGRDYARELVDPLSSKMIACAAATKMELLPNRAPSDKHAVILLDLAQTFLEHVCQSADDCPLGMRRVLQRVGEEVSKRWPQMQQSGILNLLFLRFLTPAILASAAPNDTTRRIQLLVTKLIQNLANGVPFDGRKEEHMKAFNTFISEPNQRLLQTYVTDLTDEEAIHEVMNYQASMSRYTATPAPDFVAAEEALGLIRDSLTVHLDKIWKMALTDDHTGAMLRRFLSVGLCQMYSAVGRT